MTAAHPGRSDAPKAEFRRGDLVQIGNGRKVYRIWKAAPPVEGHRGHWLYKIEPARDLHPAGATRVQDAFAVFRADELIRVVQ